MHWKVKAAMQNAIAHLPPSLSYPTYYRMQRLIGGLRTVDPEDRLAAGVQTWRRIVEQGRDPIDRVFFEVGTGTTPIVPLAYWLMGAKRTVTVDVHPYLKGELVRESLEHMFANRQDVARLFGGLLQQKRIDALFDLRRSGKFSLKRFLDLCCIDYVEPGDAARTGLPTRSIDFHTSYTVLEHIQPDVIAQILEEGNRIVRDDGLCVHQVDYSDHFSHSDLTISSINFLQYSDREWARYAGNRYMYMNRLRHDDMLALFQSAGYRILATTPAVDDRARQLLGAGRLRLHEAFAAKSPEVLWIRAAWIVAQPANGSWRGSA